MWIEILPVLKSLWGQHRNIDGEILGDTATTEESVLI